MPPFALDRPHRSSLQSLSVAGDPVRLLEHNPHRIMAVVWVDGNRGGGIVIGRTSGDAESGTWLYSSTSALIIPVFGIEEVWGMQPGYNGSPTPITVNAVYDN